MTPQQQEIETENTQEITCPHCDEVTSNSHEYSKDYDEQQCYECGQYFYYERNIEITYSTGKINKDN